MSRTGHATAPELLELAVGIAIAAGEVAMQLYGGRLEADRKADDSPVTRADRDAERLCRRLIEDRFPEDGILGEEFGEARAGARRRWILDPIDGTRSFVHGVPLFGVLVAVEEDGRPLVGVMHFPALEETVAAARGQGCFWNDAPCRVSTVDRLESALVLTTEATYGDRPRRGADWERLATAAGMARTWGDCYGHALVATGRAEAMVDPVLALWDTAALQPIVEEAGGTFTDWSGAATHLGGDGVSTNRALAQQVRRLLAEPEPR